MTRVLSPLDRRQVLAGGIAAGIGALPRRRSRWRGRGSRL